jgi:sodium transport system permease protein
VITKRRQLAVVASKEIVDNLRDRRAVSTALVMPLMGPLAMIAVFFAFQEAEAKTRAPAVPVVGQDNAPALVDWLSHQGVQVKDAPADPEAAVRTGKADVAVRIPAGFDASLREGTPALVEVICDPSKQNAAPTLGRVEQLLQQYGQQIGAMRLVLRGVDPSIMTAVRVERVDISTPDAKKALLLASLPLFLLIGCFLGGTYVAIDLTAGERERGSLEPLLLNPVLPSTFLVAKVATTVVFGLLSMLVSLAAFAVVLPMIPFDELGMDIRLAPRTAAMFVLMFIPTTFVAASLQVLVGTLSKTPKTAQAAIGFLVLIPMVPAMIVSLFPQQPSIANSVVPFLGESILSLRLLRGELVEPLHWIGNACVDTALGCVLVAITARLFGPRMLSS